ncbi:hypothetical protein BGZ65_009274, partial [Modicella reniformis]
MEQPSASTPPAQKLAPWHLSDPSRHTTDFSAGTSTKAVDFDDFQACTPFENLSKLPVSTTTITTAVSASFSEPFMTTTKSEIMASRSGSSVTKAEKTNKFCSQQVLSSETHLSAPSDQAFVSSAVPLSQALIHFD